MPDSIARRIAEFDWTLLRAALDDRGYAVTPPLLTVAECALLRALYQEEERFRSKVVMARHRFGEGEYKYFANPLPALAAELRENLYERVAPVANEWCAALREKCIFPARLGSFLEACRQAGQTRPTPLLLCYEAGGYNCLHQDLYGEIAFPLQFTILLSDPTTDFTGGEFLLLETRPRMQSRGSAVALQQGAAILFPTRYRPMRGARGWYRAGVRHGVSRIESGKRMTLGIIFHDAR